MILTDEQIAEEVALINDELKWPMFPVLPMKTIGRTPREHGILLSGSLSTIYHVGLFDLSPGQLGPQIDDAKKTTYETVEAMVRDGWIGD